jgi:hypothetical protein
VSVGADDPLPEDAEPEPDEPDDEDAPTSVGVNVAAGCASRSSTGPLSTENVDWVPSGGVSGAEIVPSSASASHG